MRNTIHKILFRRDILRPVAGLAIIVALIVAIPRPVLSRVIDGVAIVVNRDAILISEINDAMLPIMHEYREKYAGIELQKKMAELRETVINQAIENKLILQVAKTHGITSNEKTVDSRIEMIRKRFPSEEQFLQAMSAKGMTLKEYRDQVAEQVLVQDTVKRVLGREISVQDDEVEQYYSDHPDKFETRPTVKLAQIFLEIKKWNDEEEVERTRQKAAELRALATEGAEFSELAAQHSEGPYREQGGLVGTISPEDILPDLEKIAFRLKSGEISPVIQTSYGFHILKALEAFPARKIDFEEARPLIEDLIHEEKRSEKYDDWIEKLKEDSHIDIRI